MTMSLWTVHIQTVKYPSSVCPSQIYMSGFNLGCTVGWWWGICLSLKAYLTRKAFRVTVWLRETSTPWGIWHPATVRYESDCWPWCQSWLTCVTIWRACDVLLVTFTENQNHGGLCNADRSSVGPWDGAWKDNELWRSADYSTNGNYPEAVNFYATLQVNRELAKASSVWV